MQSGYGVSEMQQFMVESGCSPLFSISTADIHHGPQPQKHPPHYPNSHHHQQQQQHHHHHHLHLHPNHNQQQQQPPQPQRFPHFHPIPITQQLFQQTHQFQLFQQEQQRRLQHHHHLGGGLDQDSGPENSNSPTRIIGEAGGPPFLGGMNFRLAVNESSGGGSREGLNDEEGILQEEDGSESRVHRWPREEESAIKEPFWRPLDIDNRNNKRCKEKQLEDSNQKQLLHCKRSKEAGEDGNHSTSNYKLFSELEAICKPGGGNNNQTGSGSALTGENTPVMAAALGPNSNPNADALDHGSDTSTGEEASLKKVQKSTSSSSRRKRKRKQQLSSIATFFESLVKQLMDHQEGLHRKFLEVLERRDQERMNKEEAWRQQEASKASREASARAQEQALASAREGAIISFLEKITGESLNLPKKPQFQSQFSEESQKEENKLIEHPSDTFNNNPDGNNNNTNQGLVNTSRWPKAEVQALIGVRSSLESRFQEPGLKGPLWEEVSSNMASMGYIRSAKRCKEKWENINKYFRKTKDNAKKRPHHSKTCPYFHQLDQLYSKSPNKTLIATTNVAERKDNSELLDAIVVSTDPSSFKFPEMGSCLQLDYNGKNNNNCGDPPGSATAEQGLGRREASNMEEDEDDEDEEEDEEERGEEGEGENLEHELNQSHTSHQDEERPHESTHFFRSQDS